MATTTRTTRKIPRTARVDLRTKEGRAAKAAQAVNEGVEIVPEVEGPSLIGLDEVEDVDESEVGVDGNPTAPEDDDDVKPVAQEDAISRLATSVQRFVDVQNEDRPIKKVPWSRYKPKSVFNPTGDKKRKLTRRCYQNNHRLFIPNLYDEEISLLNQVEPGTYIDGLVTIVERQNGENLDLHILYRNATQAQRMENLTYWRNLGELLKRCLNEGPTDPAVLRKKQRRSA